MRFAVDSNHRPLTLFSAVIWQFLWVIEFATYTVSTDSSIDHFQGNQ
jgi:hypothetical protein